MVGGRGSENPEFRKICDRMVLRMTVGGGRGGRGGGRHTPLGKELPRGLFKGPVSLQLEKWVRVMAIAKKRDTCIPRCLFFASVVHDPGPF